MALPKFLLQIRDGQKNSVYRWTEMLAKRKDMRPISGREAKKILESEESERQKRLEELARDPYIDDFDDDFEENVITSDPDLANDEKKPAEHPSFKTQETIKVEEFDRIDAFRKSNTLESYLLEKYQFNMIPGTLEEMKSQAISFIEELSKHGKLYTKLNE